MKDIMHGLENKVKKLHDDAIASDGRGHFLSSYDGQEYEIEIDGEWFYIYRIN